MKKRPLPVKGVVPQGDASPKTDWEAIERMYRAGVLSVREIATQHGISHTAINKHASASGWTRDLTAKVRQEVSTALVSSEVSTATRARERDIVKEAAATVVHLVREHRKDIQAQRGLAHLLLDQLTAVADYRDLFECVIAAEDLGDSASADKKRDAMYKAVSLPQHAATLKSLADTLKIVIGLEREAFNMKNLSDEPPAPEEVSASSIDLLATKISKFKLVPVAA